MFILDIDSNVVNLDFAINIWRYPSVTGKDFVPAEEAAAELGISVATLYSYVSRGLIESVPIEDSPRRRQYSMADIAALKARRRDPAASAAAALDFGDPVLTSAITLIDGKDLYYRGVKAATLADTAPFEEVAALIWTGTRHAGAWFPTPGQSKARQSTIQEALRPVLASLGPMETFQVLLPLSEAGDLAAHDLSTVGVCRTGARLLELMAYALTGRYPDGPIAQHIQASWLPDVEEAQHAINAALVLCADHELNASSFTARCVASTLATPYAAVAAGLAALQGPRHGGHTLRCEAFLRQAISNPHSAIVDHLRRGEPLPGFGHRLYPDGDPRGRYLIKLARRIAPEAPVVETAQAVIEEVADSLNLHPNVDFGLVSLCLGLGLPRGAAIGLFAMGRAAGWIGHAIEQYSSGRMIRPRAAYNGPQPDMS